MTESLSPGDFEYTADAEPPQPSVVVEVMATLTQHATDCLYLPQPNVERAVGVLKRARRRLFQLPKTLIAHYDFVTRENVDGLFGERIEDINSIYEEQINNLQEALFRAEGRETVILKTTYMTELSTAKFHLDSLLETLHGIESGDLTIASPTTDASHGDLSATARSVTRVTGDAPGAASRGALDASHYEVLRTLEELDDWVAKKALVEEVSLSKSQVADRLSDLVEAGKAAERKDPEDGRRKQYRSDT